MIENRPSERSAKRVGARGEVERPLEQAAPRPRRPAGGQGQQQDVVAPVVVAVRVELPRRLGGGGQDLERDVALDQSRDVDLALRSATQEVAAPEQRVGMEVHDLERRVQLPGARRGGVRRGDRRGAVTALGPSHERATTDPRRQGRRRSRGREADAAGQSHDVRPGASASA